VGKKKKRENNVAYFFFENNEKLKAVFNKGVDDIVLFGVLSEGGET
jgi:hypothetical protein